MSLIVFSPSTPIKSADVNANFAGLANGSLITGFPQSGFSAALVNSSFTNSRVIICSVTITLTRDSLVHVVGSMGASAGSTVSGGTSLYDGTTFLATGNGGQLNTSVGTGNWNVNWAGVLTAGTHTINLEAVNDGSGNSITAVNPQLSVLAVPQ